MKTSVIEVRDMLSVLSVLGVEQRIGKVPGVESVTVNYAAGNATVRFDETRLNLADIKADVRQSAHEADADPADAAGNGHADHAGHAVADAPPAGSEPVASKTPPAGVVAADAAPAGGAPPGKAAPDAAAPDTPKLAPGAAPAAEGMPARKS